MSSSPGSSYSSNGDDEIPLSDGSTVVTRLFLPPALSSHPSIIATGIALPRLPPIESRRIYPSELADIDPHILIKSALPVEILQSSTLTEDEWYVIYQQYFQDPTQEDQTPLGLKKEDLPYDPRYPFIEIDVKTGYVSKSMSRFSSWHSVVSYLAKPVGNIDEDIEKIVAFGLYDQLFKLMLNPEVDPLSFFDSYPNNIRKTLLTDIININLTTLVGISLLNGHYKFIHILLTTKYPYSKDHTLIYKFNQLKLLQFNYLLIQTGYPLTSDFQDPDKLMLESIHYNRLKAFKDITRNNPVVFDINDHMVLTELIRYRRKEFFSLLQDYGFFTYTDENIDDDTSTHERHFSFNVIIKSLSICYHLNARDMIPFLMELLPKRVIDAMAINMSRNSLK